MNKDELKKTIIIEKPNSNHVCLTDGSHGVKVSFDNYPWLAFWSPEAPFICIEPWYSHKDFEEIKIPFEEREGTIILKANDSWHCEYNISVW